MVRLMVRLKVRVRARTRVETGVRDGVWVSRVPEAIPLHSRRPQQSPAESRVSDRVRAALPWP